MDIQELFLSCRKGDLSRVEFLVEQKEVELNVRDKWDSTPLYYACLCGHEDVVKFLLENGAHCEENTFDGERCLYGALNDKIKKMLKSYKAITSSTIRRDCYYEFLRRIHERGQHSDITFLVNGQSVRAHRCVLAVRSEYFAEMLENKWADRDSVTINHKMVQPRAFQAILKYLYTARLDTHFEQLSDIVRLARHCRLEALIDQIEDRMKKALTFESTKPGVNVTVISIEPSPGESDVQLDLAVLADQAIPVGVCNQADVELPFPPEEVHQYADVIFSVEGHHFHCHKVFFCERSDYFRARIEDNFGESHVTEDERHLQVVPLPETNCAVFVQILYYIYQDSCLQLTPGNVYDVLVAADMLLLPGLKRQCANVMAAHVDVENVVALLRTSRLFTLPRLEDTCAEFIASNIEKMVGVEEFSVLVREDAGGVQRREETDSIPVIDEVRFHITSSVQTFSDMYEADRKLAAIDQFLDTLDLEA